MAKKKAAPKQKGPWDPEIERKVDACNRLEKSGELEQFRHLQKTFRRGQYDGRRYLIDDAFRLALRFYPPPGDPEAKELSDMLVKAVEELRDEFKEKQEKEQAEKNKKLAAKEKIAEDREKAKEEREAAKAAQEAARREQEEAEAEAERKARAEAEAENEKESKEEARIAAQIEELGQEVGEADFSRDFEWAYNQFENKKIEPADAPSVGAWGMLQFCRGNRAKFMDAALKYFDKKSKDDSEDDAIRTDDLRQKFAVIDRLVRGAEADIKGEIKRLVAADSAAVLTTLLELGWYARKPDTD